MEDFGDTLQFVSAAGTQLNVDPKSNIVFSIAAVEDANFGSFGRKAFPDFSQMLDENGYLDSQYGVFQETDATGTTDGDAYNVFVEDVKDYFEDAYFRLSDIPSTLQFVINPAVNLDPSKYYKLTVQGSLPAKYIEPKA